MPAELMVDGNLVQMAHYDHYLVVYDTPLSEREEYRQLAEFLCNYCFVPSPWLYCKARLHLVLYWDARSSVGV